MILYSFVAVLMFLVVLCALMSVLSKSAEKFLWGTVLASLFLGLAIQLSAGGFWGFLALGGFLITDLIVYLGLRSIGFSDEVEVRRPGFDRLMRIFFLWLSSNVVALFFAFLFFDDSFSWFRQLSLTAGPNLADTLWDYNWLLVVVALASTVTSVIGGFFLVRREL
jgi:hypothetical protein